MSTPPLPPFSVPQLLRRYGLRPKKRLGQNFLIDGGSLRKVVQAANLAADEDVLEIGAGLGSLTVYLAQAARNVVAVELDADLLPPLREVLSPYSNVRLIQADILRLDLAELFAAEHQPLAWWQISPITSLRRSCVIF